MNLQIGLLVSVKFRAFGVTFGTFSKTLGLDLNTSTGQFALGSVGAAPSTGLTTLVNENGVLVQAWI